ncbi:hypothetical protein QE152_g23437 [Popillia japonica]|uniref:Uncharacterized protein n=1 Tax=Popillia japonica TaxID=7064 RepID=A0AAW1KHM2_POPJA
MENRNLECKELVREKDELTEELEEADLDLLGMTETKQKGTGEINLKEGHCMFYSGVQTNCWAKAGVGYRHTVLKFSRVCICALEKYNYKITES